MGTHSIFFQEGLTSSAKGILKLLGPREKLLCNWWVGEKSMWGKWTAGEVGEWQVSTRNVQSHPRTLWKHRVENSSNLMTSHNVVNLRILLASAPVLPLQTWIWNKFQLGGNLQEANSLLFSFISDFSTACVPLAEGQGGLLTLNQT